MQADLIPFPQASQAPHARFDDDPVVFPEIFADGINFSVWQRSLPEVVSTYSRYLAQNKANFNFLLVSNMEKIGIELEKKLPDADGKGPLIDDVVLLVDMYSELFGLEEVGCRLAVLHSAMCPKFHTDRVPCRLITTYTGAATEWSPQDNVERDPNNRVEIIQAKQTRQIQGGDVALLKGEAWAGNERNGIVHRSPAASVSEPRLVLTLDFV